MKVLVTGVAGFIGYHVAKRLLSRGEVVVGIDNLNDYYDPLLKQNRLNALYELKDFSFEKIDIADNRAVLKCFERFRFDKVVHLAAQAGVRYSIENPLAYVNSNLVGFLNVLEGCRHHNVDHLVYASSSSVYGANKQIPFSEKHNVSHPVSLYAATKRSNEAMAHSYSHLYGLPTTGLRFFTVYGPWGRPDMSPMIFANNIMRGQPIKIYNYGKHKRDFTYIEDIVDGVINVIDNPACKDTQWSALSPTQDSSNAPWRIYNIGNNTPVSLMDYIECIENAIGKKSKKEYLPIQSGDVEETYADISMLKKDFNFQPKVSIEEGVRKFIEWYMKYYSNVCI